MVVAKNMNKPILTVSMNSESDGEDTASTEESLEPDSGDEAAYEDEVDAHSDAVRTKAAVNNFDSDTDDGENADAESDDDDNKDDVLMTNEGWADSVAKILGSNKPKNKKTLVLSRAKKHADITKVEKEEKPAFEVIGEDDTDKKPKVIADSTSEEPPLKKVKYDKTSIRVKPNILEKDREKLLSKIATKGVVQLFNAVRNQQKTLQNEMDRNDLSESKKEKILKKFDKRAFLDTLMGQTKSIIVDKEAKVAKNEIKDENIPKWSALRDDFMMGAKMKDWDKESIDE